MALRVPIIIALAVFVVVGIWAVERRRRRLPPALEVRPDLPLPEIQSEFYRDLSLTQERFTELWSDVAKAFEIPPGRIRPADRFGVELPLRPMFGTTDEDLILAGSLKRRCKESGIGVPPAFPRTVDEYIRLLASRGSVSPSNARA